ncbi:M13 family metallopeptidase [Paucibacter sp. B2R-40]|uniref:M13 family metallopeptidase n=1 Tax=Paucibacter sp. B2R-40 TaxID=2893554 RepID=UPI0021E50046|nr:M13 family metallopeptidase [Paucibacter sp. B2R-40]MCV2355246.1 M13 family metallopeptidase [Paucibacter sp. B2R-40]
MKLFRLLPLAALLLTAGLAQAAAPAIPATSGLDLSGFDSKVRPQDDLFLAANGAWVSKTAIPADKAEYGSFYQLRDLSDRQVRVIVEALAANPKAIQAKGGVEQKIAAFYGSYTDLAAIDKAGLKPAKAMLASIDAIKTPADLARWLGSAQGAVNTPMVLWVMPDFKEPGINRALTWQGGLGMPDRDYYLKDDDKLSQARKAYLAYLTTLAKLSGEKAPGAAAAQVLALEKRIAEAHWDKVENRNPVKTYNPMTAAELAKAAPGFDWAAFMEAAQLQGVDRITVSQPSTMAALAKMSTEVPLADWKAYLKLRVLDENAELLPKPYREARFAFHGNALTGAKEERPRWQKGIAEVNGALGEAIGQVYVAQHFPPAYKTRMVELVSNLMNAYGDSIDGLSWMTPATKAAAKDKLSKYMVKIGYPDTWRDYSALEVREGDAFGNRARSGRFEWERIAKRVGKPVDRAEWGMTPQTVNAYYNPSMNEIVFPAAILQPPFFDMAADDAVNYGAIGAVIGHEISHGFDDQGSQFDGDGALRNWWSDADRQAFEKVGAQLVAQYEKYEPLPGKTLNGKLTLGENIADLSGLQIAYKAYRHSLGGKPAAVIDGYTGEQRFFMGWSQAWRAKARDERTMQNLTVDPHSPAKFRANGAAVNHDGFHEAFGTKPGDQMFKASEERIRIW